jgi:hypothetical protein
MWMKRLWEVGPDIDFLFAVGTGRTIHSWSTQLEPASADISLVLFFDTEDGGDTFL